MAETVRKLGIATERVRIIPNWSDGKRITPIDRCKNPLRVAWGLETQFIVGYAGNLGRAHEIETVLAAMKTLYKRSIGSPEDEAAKAIKFLFVGGAALRPGLRPRQGCRSSAMLSSVVINRVSGLPQRFVQQTFISSC